MMCENQTTVQELLIQTLAMFLLTSCTLRPEGNAASITNNAGQHLCQYRHGFIHLPQGGNIALILFFIKFLLCRLTFFVQGNGVIDPYT